MPNDTDRLKSLRTLERLLARAVRRQRRMVRAGFRLVKQPREESAQTPEAPHQKPSRKP